MRDNYEEVLFLDYPLASRKEVEQSLWKAVFYGPIEDYRSRIRKLSSRRQNDDVAATRQRQALCGRFRGFLGERPTPSLFLLNAAPNSRERLDCCGCAAAEACGFYTGLLRKMQSDFSLELTCTRSTNYQGEPIHTCSYAMQQ